ncbi:MAG TPA: cytochrome c [Bryobacteraceae bacterium]|jgi:mono/diheme cytochrome c family protein|nr:cytochrome c [Bryobacteraceae bacterium]
MFRFPVFAGALLILLTAIAAGQAPSGSSGRGGKTPLPPLDAATSDRGKAIYGAHCASCHGPDARGTARGVDLARAFSVRLDPRGANLGPFLSAGHKDHNVPPIQLTGAEIGEIAMYFRTVVNFANAGVGNVAPNIIVGDASAGKAFFNGEGKCTTCHSVTGDLKGIGSKYSATMLQNRIVLPRGRGPRVRSDPPEPERTVTITKPDGSTESGTLVMITDFLVTFRDASGALRSATRRGDVPKVAIHDPVAAHIQNMRRMTTKQMHDLTAYLVTQ